MINSDDIELDKARSHPLENSFGHLRIMCYNYDLYENLVRVTVDTIMNLILINKLQLTQNIKNRINIAGIKLTIRVENMISMKIHVIVSIWPLFVCSYLFWNVIDPEFEAGNQNNIHSQKINLGSFDHI